MILYVDLRTGEVRDLAIGVVGKVKQRNEKHELFRDPVTYNVTIEIDDAKINQKRDRSVF